LDGEQREALEKILSSCNYVTLFRGGAGTGKGGELKAADYQMSGPYTHANLTVFLIYGPNTIVARNFLTLQEALDQKKVIVFETKSVNELSIQNLSNEDVYVQSGDIVNATKVLALATLDLMGAGR
jgi:hypothetical protein